MCDILHTVPPLPNVANVMKSDLQWSLPGVALVRTRNYWRYSGSAPTATDATVLAAGIYNAMHSHDDLWTDAVNLAGCEVTDLSSSQGGQGTHAQSTVGTRGTTDLPSNATVLVNYLINRRYRGGKPRSYLPLFTQADIATPTSWDPTAVTEVDSAMTSYFGAVVGLESGSTTITDHVNVSYYNGSHVVINPDTGRAKNVADVRTTPIVDVINSFATSLRIASQRRRLGR